MKAQIRFLFWEEGIDEHELYTFDICIDVMYSVTLCIVTTTESYQSFDRMRMTILNLYPLNDVTTLVRAVTASVALSRTKPRKIEGSRDLDLFCTRRSRKCSHGS